MQRDQVRAAQSIVQMDQNDWACLCCVSLPQNFNATNNFYFQDFAWLLLMRIINTGFYFFLQ